MNKQSSVPGSGFILQDFDPAYLQAYQRGELQNRVKLVLKELEGCCACLRDCHVSRLNNVRRSGPVQIN